MASSLHDREVGESCFIIPTVVSYPFSTFFIGLERRPSGEIEGLPSGNQRLAQVFCITDKGGERDALLGWEVDELI